MIGWLRRPKCAHLGLVARIVHMMESKDWFPWTPEHAADNEGLGLGQGRFSESCVSLRARTREAW